MSIGGKAVECGAIRSEMCTLPYSSSWGLDDNKLTYFHGGRYKQLSQFGGKVISELVAG